MSRSAQRRDLHDPALYINRELSQLAFNARVLAQAEDPSMPLLERLRFLCICSTNIDEFFEIRVAALKQQISFGSAIAMPDALGPQETFKQVRVRALELLESQYQLWNKTLRPALKKQGIRFLMRNEWNLRQRHWLQEYFQREILPVLSPLGLDPAHPFPRILNKSLNIAVVLKGRDAFGREGHMAIVRAPRSLPRVIQLPTELGDGTLGFVLLSSVLHEFVDELFSGMQVKGSYQFRITRNSELIVDDDETEDLADAIKGELRGRGFAQAVRMEVADNCPKVTIKFLIANFQLDETDIYRCHGPVNLNRVSAVYDMIDRPDLKFSKFTPRVQPRLAAAASVFDAVREGDVLLHHPFDSFTSVLDFLRQASTDADVLAIKQTLYRTGTDSPLVAYLIDAARAGKDVTVVIELRARFDEEANLSLADRLQEAGVQVVYGVVGYKTHAKMLLVVRREAAGLRRYVHLSTGNYHASTARTYTDLGLLTCHPEIGDDVHKLFHQISGLGSMIHLSRLLHAPFTLHTTLMQKISREIAHAEAGVPAAIRAKINHLNEPQVIQLLYTASRAGVQIDLVIRGTCCLRPGVAGVSDNIRVRSVVGRFLEHSRVYWFANNGDSEIFCSSADWLDRNLLRRIEVCFPILDPPLAERVYTEEIENYLADNQQAWALQADGQYQRVVAGTAMPHLAQNALLAKLCH
ncbi:MAG: polyphosphate kinase 1 [Lysobacterales bacterium CG02_land_8_20_14_3_00_62_12]|nr:MAG: polyphosphate kinase 1 [Xanthomonadales bacterium CG02_land_8_20_14_3_00_62_12]